MRRFELGDFLSDGFRYATKRYSRAVVLGVLLLISFLIIPFFLVLGYLYRCIKRSIEGEEGLPEYVEWGKMFVDGVKLFVAYLIVIIPVMIVVFALTWGHISLMSFLNPMAMFGAMISAMGISFVIGLILSLYLFMAIPQMVYTDKISSIFDYQSVMDRVRRFGTGRYVAVVVVTMIIAWIINIVGGMIPVIGVILLTPIATLLMTRVQATAFKETLSTEQSSPQSS